MTLGCLCAAKRLVDIGLMIPRRSRAPTAASDSEWEREARALGRVPLFLAVGLAAIVGFSVVASGDDEPSAADEAANPAEAHAGDGLDAAASPAVVDPVAEAHPELTEPEPDALDPILASTTPTRLVPETKTANSDREVSNKPRRRAVKRTTPRRSKNPDPLVSSAPADPEAEIAAARRAGWMLEAGSLLLIFPINTPVSWDRAASLCQRRRDARLPGWRLARFGELKKLRASRSLPAGRWWSSTAAQDDTQALTLAPTEAKEISKADGRALTMCVRARPRS